MNNDDAYINKAEESLLGADSELTNRRFNNCANRCYYASFQAAVAALIRAQILPHGAQWSHEFIQAQFAGVLINRRKLYPPELRDVLIRNLELRQAADYRAEQVSETQAVRALRRTRTLVDAVSSQRT
jgi:uncharacterized protein (UPF0332 family)